MDYDAICGRRSGLGLAQRSLRLRAGRDADWGLFCWKLIEAMHPEFQTRSAEVAHVKIRLVAGSGAITAQAHRQSRPPAVARGHRGRAPRCAALLINARVHIDAQQLRSIVETCLRALADERIEIAVDQIRSFAPSRPQPTHRFDHVVPQELADGEQ